MECGNVKLFGLYQGLNNYNQTKGVRYYCQLCMFIASTVMSLVTGRLTEGEGNLHNCVDRRCHLDCTPPPRYTWHYSGSTVNNKQNKTKWKGRQIVD